MKSVALIFILLAQILVACTGGRKTPPDTLVIALASAPMTLDPRYATDANGSRIGGLIFSSLIRAGADFKPAPDAAERWTYKNRRYVFHLRKDLKFHNGRPVAAADVAFSFEQFLSTSSPFSSAFESLEDVKVDSTPEGLRVTLKVKTYSEKFLLGDLPSVRLLPKEEVLRAGREFSKVLIGTGPYRFQSQDATNIRLEAVTAKTKYLNFKVIRDDFTRYQKTLKGEIDIVQSDMPLEKVEVFDKHPRDFQVFRYRGLSMSYVLVNFKDPILKQRQVRQALAQTLDRQSILTHKLRGLGVEATSVLTPINPYFNASLKNLPTDAAAARQTIERLGLVGHKIILKTSNQPQAIDNGRVIAYQMSASGLKVEMQSFEWATFYNDVRSGNFQLATMKWVGTLDPDLYRLAYHSREVPPGRNRGSYSNPKLDALLDQSALSERAEERRKLVLEIQKIVHEDLAVIPLWYEEQVAVARKNILDYHPSPTGDFLAFVNVRKGET